MMGVLVLSSCSDKKSDSSNSAQSYSFSAGAKASLSFSSLSLTDPTRLTAGPTLCTSVVCFTPSTLTGKYYGVGLLIQSAGNGMVAYFGQDNWSDIVGSSDSYAFDSATEIANTGNLVCCNGQGDLSSENTYIESIIYLFGYLDATFTVSGVTGNTNMNREFTVRFVLADDAITGGKRGDLLLKDPTDDVFKWMDTAASAGGIVGDGTLVITRPTSPITMDTQVVSWTNPFGTDKGNQTIPSISTPVATESGEGVFQVKESDLKTEGRTYKFAFNPSNFVMFPKLIQGEDLNSLYSYSQLLKNIHLGGFPHSSQSNGVGNAGETVLSVSAP